MKKVLLTAVLVAVAAVGYWHSQKPTRAELMAAEHAELDALFEAYFEKVLEMNPTYATFIGDHRYNDRFVVGIAPENIAAEEALDREYLDKINAIDASLLEGQALLSYQIFKGQRERDVEGQRFPGHLMPANQFYLTPNQFVQMGTGKGLQPFKTVRDYDDWLKRVDGLAAWVDQAMVNMREGIDKGYVQPKILMEKVLPQLQAQIVSDPTQSLFWGPIANFPADFSEEDKARLTAAYSAKISADIVPAFQRFHDFVRDEYIPKCRDSVGMGALPDGDAWYAYNVKAITTTGLTPDEIHQIGLDEVARIQAEMQKIMAETGFQGDLKAFYAFMKTDPRFVWDTREALVAGYYDIKQRVDGNLTRLFETLPSSDYEVRAVEPFRERTASSGSYQAASPDGSRPAIFYANAYDLSARPKWTMEALSLHEGNPGHHFQIMVARENDTLPRFRRFGGFTAYSEGWGLYAESLGKELGVYTDPYQYYGMLEAEQWRAIRLVVDTGLHAKGWTRQQVLDYMAANSAAAEARMVSEAERFMAIPGQALAYKIGQLKIRGLRTRAEQALGAKFDVRKFHTEVLKDGAVPLDVLEAKVERWIAEQV